MKQPPTQHAPAAPVPMICMRNVEQTEVSWLAKIHSPPFHLLSLSVHQKGIVLVQQIVHRHLIKLTHSVNHMQIESLNGSDLVVDIG